MKSGLKRGKRYCITITDETRLQNVASKSFSPINMVIGAVVAFVAAVSLGFIVVLLTPVKTLIPGYFRESERAASEEALLRVDSLMNAFGRNAAYASNLEIIFDEHRIPEDTTSLGAATDSASDRLLLPSAAEESFARMMQEREKFNVKVKASMAAEGMLFYPVSNDGVVTMASRSAFAVHVSTPPEEPVMALADGSVLASFYDASSHGYSLILQHDNGFVSRYSALETPFVAQGDNITGGEVIASPPKSRRGKGSEFVVELWHNGMALRPYEYISTHKALNVNN